MNRHIYQLSEQLGALLNNKNMTVTTAESCTGGMVAAAITDIAGSSAWFNAGVVSYSNQIKEQMLSVPAETLEQYGAVSLEVTQAMLAGVLVVSKADIGVAISGIAGPDGGSPDKPVGTVCFSWGAPNTIKSEVKKFAGNRAEVREKAVAFALERLIQSIQ